MDAKICDICGGLITRHKGNIYWDIRLIKCAMDSRIEIAESDGECYDKVICTKCAEEILEKLRQRELAEMKRNGIDI